ncbi:MAG: parallel beta-helix repeat protein [Candidatus Azotimanducaceae bacterium]|jgi:parallel beta-helix repeat protein
MKISKKYIILASVFIIMVLPIVSILQLKNSSLRNEILQNPILQHFVHTYYSLRKIPDILFIPYMVTDSKLPTYTLEIPHDNIARMNAKLPDDPMFGTLEEENKLYVNANFSYDQYADRVKVRYRGLNANHWNKQKKSLRVQFPSSNYFNGARLLNFIMPFDRKYFIEPLNMHRTKKFGLIDVDMYFSRLNINGVDTGVYLTFEHFSPEWLAKKALPEEKLFGLRDGTLDGAASTPDDFVNMLAKETDVEKEELVTLLTLIQHADDATFENVMPYLVDLEKLYKWNIINILAGISHQTESENAVLYFNSVTGKFEIIPWDTSLGDRAIGTYDVSKSPLMSRLLSVPDFRARHDALLRTYIENEENLREDLAFYDQLYEQTKVDFFKDHYKHFNNFNFLATVREQRQRIEDHWYSAVDVLDPEYDYAYQVDVTDIELPGSFAHFQDVHETLDTFLAKNRQFYKINGTEVGLIGTHNFTDDVIIPSGITLRIMAGTNLYMEDEVSIVSYGAVHIFGTDSKPVSISPSSTNKKSWGTFAVVNAPTSTVQHLIASGGSGDRIHGIAFSGMVAFHNTDVQLTDSVFESAMNDDALNVKMSAGWINNSIFKNNSSDGIDLDYAKGEFTILTNTFTKNGGDAIDLSHSNVLISENTIRECADKGISVGEVSTTRITKNTISECRIGIAVKDLSQAEISENSITDTETAISLYLKKHEFGGGSALLKSNEIEDNENDVSLDEYSDIRYE